jgi:RNA polymerase sigma factor (TIGR02999 family)
MNENDLSTILHRVHDGDEQAVAELYSGVEVDLRVMVQKHLQKNFGRDQPGITLQATAFVDDVFMKLIKQRNRLDNRGHFFAIATKVLVRAIGDYHDKRKAQKRGLAQRIDMGAEFDAPDNQDAVTFSDLADSLERLRGLDARKSEVASMKVLWGLTIDEIATSLGVSRPTAERDWKFCKAWLANELS